MKWLSIDCNYLCHRAHHTTGSLSHEGQRTGVIYGVLKEIKWLIDRFDPEGVALTFDLGKPIRREILPGYKLKRHTKELTPEEKEEYKALRDQMTRLRTDIFPRIGFHNILSQDGYEADDMLAMVVRTLREDEHVVVSADADLWQLVEYGADIYRPVTRDFMTKKKLREKFGIGPEQWAKVKALAGCSSDEIPGIPKVGEKTAAKYLAGDLPSTHKTYEAIRSKEGQDIARRNWKLVKLPYKGTKRVDMKPGVPYPKKWRPIFRELGIKSLTK